MLTIHNIFSRVPARALQCQTYHSFYQ